jgi:hypothetical protein
MEYAEKGSLADALRVGRLKRPNGYPDLITVVSCLLDIASGAGLERPLLFAWLRNQDHGSCSFGHAHGQCVLQLRHLHSSSRPTCRVQYVIMLT